MKKYLVEWIRSGNDRPTRKVITAKDDADIVKKVYIKLVYGCDDGREYNSCIEDGETLYGKLDVNECLDEFEYQGDVLEFIVDSKFNYVYKRGI